MHTDGDFVRNMSADLCFKCNVLPLLDLEASSTYFSSVSILLEEVKGQGPGEKVTSRETAQLKLGLRLAFTVKMVNPWLDFAVP